MSQAVSSRKGLRKQRTAQRDTLALVMAGGNGSRLGALTKRECKPALSFAGSYRNIDFTLSNCVNSGLRRIAVLTQYNAHSLLHHITQNWNFLSPHLDEFIELWPAQQRGSKNWYSGTANAIAQNMDLIRDHAPEHVVILAGDHIYKMDYSELLAFHRQRNAGLTVSSIVVSLDEAKQFGVMSIDREQCICSFQEKPALPSSIPGHRNLALASMGIYVFKTEFLLEALRLDAENPASSHDFGRDILPWAIQQGTTKAFAFPFRDPDTVAPGYWRDVGTVDAYWQAQMDLLEPHPRLDLYDREWPLMACSSASVPARIVASSEGQVASASDSLLGGGCVIAGGHVQHSLLSTGVFVGAGSRVIDSVVLPGARIGKNCQLNKVIVGSDCVVPNGTVIGQDLLADCRKFQVSAGGVVLVTEQLFATDTPSWPKSISHRMVA